MTIPVHIEEKDAIPDQNAEKVGFGSGISAPEFSVEVVADFDLLLPPHCVKRHLPHHVQNERMPILLFFFIAFQPRVE